MRKFNTIVLSVILVLSIMLSTAIHINSASLFASDGYYFSIDTSTTASVSGRYIQDEAVKIPREFSDHYITAISDNAFAEDEHIVSLDMADADMLESIGNYAFYNCTKLSGTVVLNGRLKSLGLSAFQGCGLLDTVEFYSNNVTLIPEQCFYNCVLLNNIILPERLKRIDKFAFANCGLTKITIPDTVEYIDPTSFVGNDNLVIYCYTNSYAHQFAEENQITHVLLDTDNGYYLGDVDNNRAVEILDITFIQRSLANMTIPDDYNIEHGDIDGDNQIASTDNAIMMRSLAGLITDFPVGEWVVQHEIHQY